MPLIITLGIDEDVFIADDRIVVKEIYGDGDIDIEANGEPMQIGDAEMSEVFPDVMMSAGLLANHPNFIRLVIDAPREKRILRGDKYRLNRVCNVQSK